MPNRVSGRERFSLRALASTTCSSFQKRESGNGRTTPSSPSIRVRSLVAILYTRKKARTFKFTEHSNGGFVPRLGQVGQYRPRGRAVTAQDLQWQTDEVVATLLHAAHIQAFQDDYPGA